ncbi:hypothetical protein TNCV_985431 [Trichonephila clavipes]|nr:hypothetical protein TNCV_985431 [Trichonephila clavipes]
MTSVANFSAASAHSCTIHSCSYKPADTGESCRRRARLSHGGDTNYISATELICDTSTGSPRPFVPHNFRRTIFEHFHNLAHPGVAASFNSSHPDMFGQTCGKQ